MKVIITVQPDIILVLYVPQTAAFGYSVTRLWKQQKSVLMSQQVNLPQNSKQLL